MDVALGTSLGISAARGLHDVAVIVSGDNDYLTAINMIRALGGCIEVATWYSANASAGTFMRVPRDIRRLALDEYAFIHVAEDPRATSRVLHKAAGEITPIRQALIDAGLVRAAA